MARIAAALVSLFLLAAPAAAQVPPAYLQAKAFGALGDGATDDTVALQAWLDACQIIRGACWLDPGTYRTHTLHVTGSMSITGPGMYLAALRIIGCAEDGISIDLAQGGRFQMESFSIFGCAAAGGVPTDGACLRTAHSGGHVLRNVGLSYCHTAFHNAGTGGFGTYLLDRIDASECYGDCIVSIDAGDAKIVNSIISARFQGSGTGVHHVGYCGISITNNKITYGSRGIWFDGPGDADCVARGNSIEGQYGDGIVLTMGGSSAVGNVQIQDNQIGVYGRAITIGASTDTGGPQFTQITGNLLNCASAPSATGIILYVSLAALVSNNTVAGCYQGIYIGGYANNTRIGPHSFDPASVTVRVTDYGATTRFTPWQAANPY